jgi:Holliday junction resolvasome RuvABC DNA-binding subunit
VAGLAPRNEDVADALERVADLLEAQDENPFRVRAWRAGAQSVRASPREVAELLAQEGLDGLDRLPGVGKSLAGAIAELVHTGRLRMLDRLEGEISPEDLFTTVPGIGEDLAARIHRELHVDTLEELELAAHDGRLAAVAGFGPRRVRAVREALAGMLGRSTRRRARRVRRDEAQAAAPAARPSVETLLAVDAEYRRRAAAGELRTIAPRRFNPERRAWLPVLHSERDGWAFTALYSNTARAHELGTTRDWVILYYERDGDEDQCTVVTERQGPLAGRRVVRGREAECRALAG